MSAKQDLPILPFASGDAWKLWLAAQHATARGVWLKIAKKGSGIATVTYAEALDVALCYGWIDGQRDAFDGDYFLQRFTPRRPKSKWSKINCAKVEQLTAQAEMQPAGLREMQRAKEDGRWEAAYDAQSRAVVPDDLQQELDSNAVAQEFFASLDRLNRYAILYRIQNAKKPETRARRIATFVAMLNECRKVYP
ncbi:MAG TPA: YdeI/OmpD-associated family protein [Chloroflexota bacterium]|nr:YdeI/OmpD-associated family protein [Chloroflexota bacterium]